MDIVQNLSFNYTSPSFVSYRTYIITCFCVDGSACAGKWFKFQYIISESGSSLKHSCKLRYIPVGKSAPSGLCIHFHRRNCAWHINMLFCSLVAM
jgi:hypothetical protein